MKGKDITDEEYLTANKVWNVFGMKTFGEYHDLYLKCDVLLLLCDVFEKFIDVCLEYYGLDPCHYSNSPGLAWDAMLKMRGVKLKLIDDINVHLFVERSMRGGGVFHILQRAIVGLIMSLLKGVIVVKKRVLLLIGT